MDEIRADCHDMLMVYVAACKEEGLEPWRGEPPPDYAVAEIVAMPQSHEFTITLELP